MIIVTSTAKDAATCAPNCVGSVRAASERVRGGASHWYIAADYDTGFAALSAQWFGLDVRIRAKPQLQNLRDMWNRCAPSDIIVHLDGDDELTEGALEHVRTMYENPHCWLTYGSFQLPDGSLDRDWHPYFGKRYARGGDPRAEPWRASHMKTFRAGLVQYLLDNHENYLVDASGKLFETCLDLAVMFPLLDLAGENYTVSQEINVVYNRAHSERESARTVRDRVAIRSRPRLPPLETRCW